jgi:rhodanese-related sulfurtransferase
MKRLCASGTGIVSTLFLFFGAAIIAGEHTKDSVETIKKSIAAKKAVLVDVREKAEWDQGHLRDATLLPLSEIPEKVSGKVLEKQFSKDTILYLHCASGRRCLTAADILSKSGYDVRPLRDGYEALLQKGFPKSEK